MNINWGKIKKIHFVGIKGVAMTALAVWAKEAGYTITGSDVREQFPTDDVLLQAKISVLDLDSKNIVNIRPDIVIYTGALGGKQNPEVVEADSWKIPTLPHGKALGLIMETKKQISVAGSHGKTTTTAMIATILSHAERDPSWAIGCGEIRGLGLPGHFGHGQWFVAEADEYVTDPGHDATPRFFWQKPEILVVTNIDYDHPDAYFSLNDLQNAFISLQKKSSLTITNADDKASRVLSGNLSYGLSSGAQYQVCNIHFESQETHFSLFQKEMKLSDFSLKVPGKHNALNAAAAAITCNQIGLSWESIAEGLRKFGGTKRRFELLGSMGDIHVYDDYAHHPNEIKATLEAAHEWYPSSRLIVVFQPHTYSRTKALLSEFASSFAGADEVLLTDIYASARETDTLGISGKSLVVETAKLHRNVYYAPGYTAVSRLLRKDAEPGDVILFMGAGDIYGWSKKFLSGE